MFGRDPAPTPAPPPLPDPLPSAPQYASGTATKAAGNRSTVPGFGSTLMTSGQGVDSTSTNSMRKSLLGQ